MPTQIVDRETFLTRVRASGLLTEDGLARVDELAAGTDRVKRLARSLVDQGILTRFQAEMIYRGRTDGFQLGQYRILEQIGRGGMGRVFKAQHQAMNRVVALKVLAADLMKTERARKLFQREVWAAAKLVHPNIVTAYDANHSGGRHYLVMEFVDGPNLHELVKERGPLPIGQACDFIRQAALGLQYAHEMGMVHRDVKPANLLVHRVPGQRCVVKILDFGLARLQRPEAGATPAEDSLPTVDQQVMGTPDYLSPEQARNLHRADIRSDLYSLGCTFYFLLSGQVPFGGGTTLEKLVRHSSETPVPVERYRPEIPAEVSAVVAKLLAKRPDDRYQTPVELAQALAPLSEQASASFPSINLAETAAAPSSGDSPWGDLFDDEREAFVSTAPADASVTPVPPGVRQLIRTAPPGAPAAPSHWPRVLVIVGAALLGFLVGVVSLFLWMR